MEIKDGQQEGELDEAAEAAAEEAAFEDGFAGEDSEVIPEGDDDDTAGEGDDSAGDAGKTEDSGDAAKDEDGQETEGEVAASGDDGQEDTAGAAAPEPDAMEVRLRRLEGRYGSLSRDVKTTTEQVATLAESRATQQVEAGGGDAPTAAQIQEAKGSSEKYEALKEEFPEFAEAMDEQLSELGKQMVSKEHLDAVVREAIEADRAARELEAVEKEAEEGLEKLDWKKKIAAPEFREWWLTQPEDIQALSQSDSYVDAHTLVAKYAAEAYNSRSEDRETSQGPDTSRLEGAITPTSGGARKALDREPTDDEDFLDGFHGR